MSAPPKRQPHPDDWCPNSGAQTRFLSLTCREALYGGAAGGGKSASLLVDAIRYLGRGYGPAYKALLLRRTYPELEKSLIPESKLLYRRFGGKYNAQSRKWTFPAGETVWFGHIEHDDDRFKYQSDEFQFIGFDELTHFSEVQYLYLGFSRMRSSKGIPLRLRAGTNPGGDGHEWVFRRFGPWLDPESKIKADPGQVLYLRRDGEVDRLVDKGTPRAISRCFVPASTADNPHISEEYRSDLEQLDPVTRAQLRDGNWLIKPGRGLMFKRLWFEIVQDRPRGPRIRWCRYWDLAATEDDPAAAWTVGVLMAIADDGIYVVDVIRFQGSPGTVESTILQTARIDGRHVAVGLPQDPGQAGVAQVVAYQKLLEGFNIRFLRESGDKVTRAKPLSAQCEPKGSRFGRVKLVVGEWNLGYLEELEGFPDLKTKDRVDASSGAFTLLTSGAGSEYTGLCTARSERTDDNIYGNR